MVATEKVTLGGKTYTLKPLSIKKSQEWRNKLRGPFSGLIEIIENADKIELTNLGDIAGLVKTFSGTLLGSMEIVLDLLFDYSPDLAAAREEIEENAYDAEALDAFAAVLRLAYPLGRLRNLFAGPQHPQTSKK